MKQKKQRYKALFVVSFWCVLFSGLIGVALLLFAPREQRESERENRYLAGFPQLSAATIADGSFMTGFDAFLSDGFFLRDSLVDTSKRLLQAFSTVTADEQLADVDALEEQLDEFMGEGVDAAAQEPAVETENIDITQEAEQEEPEQSEMPPETAAPATSNVDTTGMKEIYTFWKVAKDGTVKNVYKFPLANIAAAAEILNAYRAALPEDGTLHFLQVPYPDIAASLSQGTSVGWGSDMEEALQSLCDEGVKVHSGTAILEQALLAGEYVYYRTDHHWSSYGAYLATASIMESQGVPAADYRDFQYTIKNGVLGSLARDNAGVNMTSRADALELLHPAAPEHYLVVTDPNDQSSAQELPLIGYERDSYTAFLYGTRGPWRCIYTGFETGRKLLMITDSFGNVFAPYILPYYSELHMVDLRPNYITEKTAGASVAAYIEKYGITDVIVLLSTSSSVNAVYMQDYMPLFLHLDP